jgi:hypothetical protein
VPITALTILVPVIAGRVIRRVSRSYHHYRGYWQGLITLCCVGVVGVMDWILPYEPYSIVFGTIYGLIGLMFFRRGVVKLLSHRARTDKTTSTIYICTCLLFIPVFIGCMVADRYTDLGQFGWTGVIPTVYLLVFWARDYIQRVFKAITHRFRRRGSLKSPSTAIRSRTGLMESGEYQTALSHSGSSHPGHQKVSTSADSGIAATGSDDNIRTRMQPHRPSSRTGFMTDQGG